MRCLLPSGSYSLVRQEWRTQNHQSHLPNKLMVSITGESGWITLPALHPVMNVSSKSQTEKLDYDEQSPC